MKAKRPEPLFLALDGVREDGGTQMTFGHRFASLIIVPLFAGVVSAAPLQNTPASGDSSPPGIATKAAAQGTTQSARGGGNAEGAQKVSGKPEASDKAKTSDKAKGSDKSKASNKPKAPSNSYTAEFGRFSGGEFRVPTKSGTNDLHGSFFESTQNSGLNARNFFDKPDEPIPPFQRNQFGGNLGGRIVRDRTFFFAAFEGLRLSQSQGLRASVPTPAMVHGDFSELLIPGNPWTEKARPIIDPVTGEPFSGNIIPANRIDRIGSVVAAKYPWPNRPDDPTRHFTSNPKVINTETYSVRMDHQFRKSVKLFGHYSISTSHELDAFGQFIRPGYGRDDNTRTQNLAIVSTITFNPRMTNEVRLGFNRIRQRRQLEDKRDGLAALGLTGLDRRANEGYKKGFPLFRISGFDSIGPGSGYPPQRLDNTYQIVDNFSYVHGSHTIKIGVDSIKAQFFTLHPTNTRGNFQFTGRYSGFGLADLLLGLPSQTEREVLPEEMRYLENYRYGSYIQYDWKVRPTLTVNIGLRWELDLPYTDVNNQIARFDPTRNAIEIARVRDSRFDPRSSVPVAMPLPIVVRNSNAMWDADWNNVAPRFAVAWRPFKKKQSVLRAGYGVYYDTLITGTEMSGFTTNVPFFFRQTFNANPRTPDLTLKDPFPESADLSPLAPSGIGVPERPYTQHFSLGIQHEINPNLLVDVAYVGYKGTNLRRIRNINQALPGPGSVDSRRPFPGLEKIAFREASANSMYHSWQVRVEKKLSRGLSFQSSYTLAKSIDDDSSPRGAQNEYDLKAEKALSTIDTRHRLVFNYAYKIPVGSGQRLGPKWPVAVRHLLGGWEVSAVATLISGRPFTPMLSRDNSGTGHRVDRPDLVGNPTLDRKDPSLWFNTGAFALPSAGRFGNAGRNILIGPGTNNVNFSLVKNHRFKEPRTVQFRAEFYNFFNHPNFLLPNPTVDSPQFGRISGASSPRQIQFGLTYSF